MSATRRIAVLAGGAGLAAATAATGEIRKRVRRGHPSPYGPDLDLLRKTAARMTTPLLPDDYLHLLNPLWTTRELRGKVVDVRAETAEAATLVIQPGWGFRHDYQAGQFVGIGVSLNGTWHWRSYSLTSVPSTDSGLISITVKAMPEGFLSGHLVDGLAPGTIVRLALPQGEFVLPDPPPAKLLFLTAGSGVTPVMAMLRTLDRRGTLGDVVLIHSSPTEASTIFREELQGLADRHEGLRLTQRYTDTQGVLQLSSLDDLVPDWRQRQTWACGPAPMLEACERHWQGIDDHLHLERFSATLSESAEGGTITFATTGKQVEVDGATTILEAAESAGLALPYGCRMGICHTCVLPLVKGRVKDLRNGQEHEENTKVQTCVSAAAGDCTIGG